MIKDFPTILLICFCTYTAILSVLTMINELLDKIEFIHIKFLVSTSTFWVTIITTTIMLGTPAIIATLASMVLFDVMTARK